MHERQGWHSGRADLSEHSHVFVVHTVLDDGEALLALGPQVVVRVVVDHVEDSVVQRPAPRERSSAQNDVSLAINRCAGPYHNASSRNDAGSKSYAACCARR